jgi:uncharacterized protein
MSRLWDMGLVRSTTAFLSPDSDLSFNSPITRTNEEPTIPALRPLKPILPEGEAILQPPMDNTPNEAPAEPSSRIPHLGHALLFVAFALLLLAITQLIFMETYHTTPGHIAASIPNKLIVASEAFTYLATLLAAWFVFPHLWHRSFPDGLQLNPAAARRNVLRLVPLGIALSFIVQALSSLITMPKSIPMDDFFRTASDVWIVTIFGVLLAPFFEETLFRGFLFPAFAIAYDWLCLPRTEAARDQWNSSNRISNPAYIFGAVLSSIFFTALHGQQVAFAWPVLLLLFCVSLILTAVRYRLRSVLASTLVHASYNFAIFLTAFISTGGYRHLDRMAR